MNWQQQVFRLGWEVRRNLSSLHAQIGGLGLFVMGSFLGCISLWAMEYSDLQQIAALNNRLISTGSHTNLVERPVGTNGASNISEFEKILPSDSDTPSIVQSLLSLANKNGLVILRGDYRKQIDVQGKFQQYQMTWPIKGSASSVYQFIDRALKEQRSLALRDLQFKREKVDGAIVEAKLEFVLFIQMPTVVHPEVSSPVATIAVP